MFQGFREVAGGESRCPCRRDGWNFELCLRSKAGFRRALAPTGPSTGGTMAELRPLVRECSVALRRLEECCPNFIYRNGTVRGAKRPASPAEEGGPADGEWIAMRKRVRAALASGEEGRPLGKKAGYSVTAADLRTVLGRNWLNDVVIDVYMQLVADKAAEMEGRAGIYAFSTHFYSVLRSRGYEAVTKWTENVDLFSYGAILVPVHARDHWSLAVLNVEAKQLDFYDSMGRRNGECCRCLMDYLRREHRDKTGSRLTPDTWESHYVRSIPVQNNTYDCGAFVCLYAECLVRGTPFDFTGKDLPRLRYRIAYEILQGRLL